MNIIKGFSYLIAHVTNDVSRFSLENHTHTPEINLMVYCSFHIHYNNNIRCSNNRVTVHCWMRSGILFRDFASTLFTSNIRFCSISLRFGYSHLINIIKYVRVLAIFPWDLGTL